eukprot:gene25281-biopygen15018
MIVARAELLPWRTRSLDRHWKGRAQAGQNIPVEAPVLHVTPAVSPHPPRRRGRRRAGDMCSWKTSQKESHRATIGAGCCGWS